MRTILIEHSQLSVFEAFRKNARNEILTCDPDLYGSRDWTKREKSSVIESVMLGFPLPVILLTEVGVRQWKVIDGNKRLHAIFGYLRSEYPLKDLQVIPVFNDRTYDRIDLIQQRRIEDYALSFVFVRQVSDYRMLYELVKRFHKGKEELSEEQIVRLLKIGMK